MLIEFTVGNFKSFRGKTTFSMIAANLTSDDPALDQDNVIPVKRNLRLLKSAALYGANASGKSNLGLALRFMRQFVLDSAREASTPTGLGLESFLLDIKTPRQPSFFEMVFMIDGIQYRYGFEVDKSHIISEWLFYVPKTKEVALFTREEQEVSARAGFKEGKGLEVRTRPGALYLSVAALFNGVISGQVQGWFDAFIVTTGLQDEEFHAETLRYLRDPKQRRQIVEMIQELDFGIDNLAIYDPPSPDTRQSIHAIYYLHNQPRGEEGVVSLDIDTHASQGTRKLIATAGPLHRILASGQIMFIDELDARLHPLMTRRIIDLLHSPLTNPKGAQLIFATHDTNLLDKSLFRRDQIWFAEKDQQGATHLASLAEYRVRNDAAFEKNYLEGRYGAIPFLGDLTRLPWAQDREAPEEGAEREPAHARPQAEELEAE